VQRIAMSMFVCISVRSPLAYFGNDTNFTKFSVHVNCGQ